MKFRSSILDFPRKRLPEAIWEYLDEEELPHLRSELRERIFNKVRGELAKFGLSYHRIMLYGGSASYQWNPGADVDTSVYVKWGGKYSNDQVEKIQDYFKKVEFEFGGHPVHFFLKAPDQEVPIEISDAAYDVTRDKWVLPPLVLPEDFDPEGFFKPFIKVAEKEAKHFDLELGELSRDYVTLRKHQEALPDVENQGLVQKRIHELVESVSHKISKLVGEYLDVREDRNSLYIKLREELLESGEISRMARFQEPEIVWKYLDRAGYLKVLDALKKLWDSGKLKEFLEQT